MNYQQAWQFLDKLQFFKIKLGLDSMRIFLDRLGRPDRKLSFIHLAGTNGKGSVGAILDEIFARAGVRAAFYTSPHLSSVRERFRIGQKYISEEDFARHANDIVAVMGGDRITYFEFTTALGLLWFAASEVDIVILETGLGGRLDATNVVTPLISVITNIAMDHQAYLGDTIAEVAAEKAGIIKPGVPVVSGVEDSVAVPVVERFCRDLLSPFIGVGADFNAVAADRGKWDYQGRHWDLAGLSMNLSGRHQVANGAVALAALECLSEQGFVINEAAIRAGLAKVRWPARLESFALSGPACGIGRGEDRRVLIDGAHNPAGAKALARALRHGYRRQRLIVVWAAMADKDISATLGEIAPLADAIFLTRPEFERSASTGDLAACLATFTGEIHLEDEVAAALTLAFAKAGADDLVLIAGSLYLAGRAREIMLGGLV